MWLCVSFFFLHYYKVSSLRKEPMSCHLATSPWHNQLYVCASTYGVWIQEITLLPLSSQCLTLLHRKRNSPTITGGKVLTPSSEINLQKVNNLGDIILTLKLHKLAKISIVTSSDDGRKGPWVTEVAKRRSREQRRYRTLRQEHPKKILCLHNFAKVQAHCQ